MNLVSPSDFSRLSESDYIAIQNELSGKIVQQCPFAFEELRTVAGVDLAYWGKEEEYAVCCIVIFDVESKRVTEKQWSVGRVEFPYIPGCPVFGELPLVVETDAKLKHKPDAYLFDGNGILHPRRMGPAAHASFYLNVSNVPTAGIAKHYFKVDGTEFTMPSTERGSASDIARCGEILGRSERISALSRFTFRREITLTSIRRRGWLCRLSTAKAGSRFRQDTRTWKRTSCGTS